jgi:predicted nucleotidyltransferase
MFLRRSKNSVIMIDGKTITQIIREVFEKNKIDVLKIILFGSRARGSFREDSDWDFLVLIDRNLDFHGKWKIIEEIKRKLAKLRIPNDILVKSEEQFNIMKDDVGTISYYIYKEGIEI